MGIETHHIDVLMPVYNAERTVAGSIESILNQTIQSFRIIVIDDGSTDTSVQIVEEIVKRDTRVVLLRKPNTGIVDALNIGLSYATAEFIARLDGDDLSDPDRFDKQLSYLNAHPDCVAISCNARLIDENGNLIGGNTDFGNIKIADPTFAPSIEPYLSHPFLFLRRTALLSIGGYRHVFHAEDVDLYWRLQHVGRIHGLSEVHGSYRVHAASITNKSILNARIAAVNAQLAAVSELRWRNERPDITFFADRSSRYQEAKKLSEIVEIAGSGLDPGEMAYLRIASAAKLLEWTKIRPFELEISDCNYLKAVFRNIPTFLNEANVVQLKCDYRAAFKRLVKNHFFLRAILLIDMNVITYAVRRLAFSRVGRHRW